jgi:hypothetical protein
MAARGAIALVKLRRTLMTRLEELKAAAEAAREAAEAAREAARAAAADAYYASVAADDAENAWRAELKKTHTQRKKQ